MTSGGCFTRVMLFSPGYFRRHYLESTPNFRKHFWGTYAANEYFYHNYPRLVSAR